MHKLKPTEVTIIIENQIERSMDVLIEKNNEYGANNDRLHNFRVAAELQNCTMEQALAGMMCKHTISIYDMIQGLSDDEKRKYPLELWEEKITDNINYLLLLKAVVEERYWRENSGRNMDLKEKDEPILVKLEAVNDIMKEELINVHKLSERQR